MQQSGRCLCGAVRFSVEHVETKHHACHCGMCRRWSGGAALFVADVRGLVFESDAQLGRYRSSDWAERGFCRQCGTVLFYYFVPKQVYMMSVGAFDDPSAFQLTHEIYIDHKPDGYAFAGDHVRWTEAEALAHFTQAEASPAT